MVNHCKREVTVCGWGEYRTVCNIRNRYSARYIVVRPHSMTPLQYHIQRDCTLLVCKGIGNLRYYVCNGKRVEHMVELQPAQDALQIRAGTPYQIIATTELILLDVGGPVLDGDTVAIEPGAWR